jgi:AAA15 family ATPase/GTPase
MYISKFRIRNYKSYFDSGEIQLGGGINIITGQNNSGKTSLLQAISLQFSNAPHRSAKTLPTQLSKNSEESTIDLEITITKEDFLTYIFDYMTELRIPVTHEGAHIYNDHRGLENLVKEQNIITMSQVGQIIQYASLSSLDVKLPIINKNNWLYHINKETKTFNFRNEEHGNFNSFYQIAHLLKDRIYYFHAERLNIGSANFGGNVVLKSNASNLPEVLNILQGDKRRFDKYINYAKKIFPQIYDISIRPDPKHSGHVEIVIWNEDPKFERQDLVVPLAESGTGLGQVLAILYVVLTSDISKVIIIDEPNSFLHPGAARKLIEILKEHPQHQFIISTHSPSTIAAANPKTINIVRTENAESKIECVDVTETKKQHLYLAEIGAKLSDVFGADNILWVEGKTEEICFPKIAEASKDFSLMGSVIIGVKNTGDFQSKNAELIFQIYDKLSKGKGLLPAAVGFIFDKEEHTDLEIEDLKRRSRGSVSFINRMMYENYLLNPNAIYNILSNIEEIADLGITEENIYRMD